MYHYSQGTTHRQGHKNLPEGTYEEEQGRKGFYGAVSHLVRRSPSTRWTNIEGNLQPHLFDLVELANLKEDKQGRRTNHPGHPASWIPLLFNTDLSLYYSYGSPFKAGEELYGLRNANGDLLYFCHKGKGVLLSDYGLLSFRKGSYIQVPKCVTHSFVMEEESEFFVIESRTGPFQEPDRGMVGRNAVYDAQALDKPDLEARDAKLKELQVEVLKVDVRHGQEQTRFTYDKCFYDTLGWKGDFFPFTLHVEDLMPLMSHRVHLPPSAHTTFVAKGFVVCTFLPRPLEEDKDAVKVPFYHQNIDYDEVLFYHDGNFFSRDNLHAGMLSLHPAGFPHGPHPKAVHSIEKKTRTDEYAVMVDSWQPLQASPQVQSVEVQNYWRSWCT